MTCFTCSHIFLFRYHQKAYDDDLRSCRQVQELPGLLRPGDEERRLHVPHEGSRSQRAERSCRRRCARRIRQIQVRLPRLETGQLNHLLPNTPSTRHFVFLSDLVRSRCREQRSSGGDRHGPVSLEYCQGDPPLPTVPVSSL